MLNHDFEGFSTTGRAREVPFAILSNWMASRLFTKMSAGDIFDAVESYAAEMGYTKAEAQEIRNGLNPKMITSKVASIQGRVPINPGSLSAGILWGDSNDIQENLEDYMKEFNIK